MNNDKDHPWLRSVWVRALLVAVCVGVALWDLSNGEYVWALIFGGLGGYAVYAFFIVWNKDRPATPAPEKPADKDEPGPGER